jgi:hypothetical protein
LWIRDEFTKVGYDCDIKLPQNTIIECRLINTPTRIDFGIYDYSDLGGVSYTYQMGLMSASSVKMEYCDELKKGIEITINALPPVDGSDVAKQKVEDVLGEQNASFEEVIDGVEILYMYRETSENCSGGLIFLITEN